jgi:hypothetical protein
VGGAGKRKLRLSKLNETFYSAITKIITNSPRKALRVSEIYTLLYANYGAYLNPNWKNSVRHALSFRSFFHKCQPSDDDNATKGNRGCLWKVNEEKGGELLSLRRERKRIKTLAEIEEMRRIRHANTRRHIIRLQQLFKVHYAHLFPKEEN